MAYSDELIQRIRKIIAKRKDVVEMKMFGSVAFMVNGNMACGPHGESLIIRIGNDAAAQAMKQPHVKPMTFTGRVLKSFAEIQPYGIKTNAQLRRWINLAASYAASLPSDKSKSRPARAATKNRK